MVAIFLCAGLGSLIIFWMQITHVSNSADDLVSRRALQPRIEAESISVNPTILEIEVSGFRNPSGYCQIAVFREATGFPDPRKSVLWRTVTFNNGIAKWSIDGITPGEIAIMAFEDEDKDGELTRNPDGTIEENMGFSHMSLSSTQMPSFDIAKQNISLNRKTRVQILLRSIASVPPATK